MPSLAGTTSVHGGKITNAKTIENASQIQTSRRLAILLSMKARRKPREEPPRPSKRTQLSFDSSTFWQKTFQYSNSEFICHLFAQRGRER